MFNVLSVSSSGKIIIGFFWLARCCSEFLFQWNLFYVKSLGLSNFFLLPLHPLMWTNFRVNRISFHFISRKILPSIIFFGEHNNVQENLGLLNNFEIIHVEMGRHLPFPWTFFSHIVLFCNANSHDSKVLRTANITC